jgi:multisubunit Na+/H+ antiporter MnhE subunit
MYSHVLLYLLVFPWMFLPGKEMQKRNVLVAAIIAIIILSHWKNVFVHIENKLSSFWFSSTKHWEKVTED